MADSGSRKGGTGHARTERIRIHSARKRPPGIEEGSMNLEAAAFEFRGAGRIPGDGAGGIKADASVGPAHRFVHWAGAVQKVSIGGGEIDWQKQHKQTG